MPHKLTLKQDRFAHEYVRNGGNASAAYRTVYDCDGSSEPTINVHASQLTVDDKVATRIAEIETEYQLLAGMTPESVIAELDIDRENARRYKQIGTAVRTTELMGRHIGMWPNKAEVAVKVDHSLSLEGITEDDMRELAAAARERRLALESGAIDTEYQEAD